MYVILISYFFADIESDGREKSEDDARGHGFQLHILSILTRKQW